jgi:hypothetical protein
VFYHIKILFFNLILNFKSFFLKKNTGVTKPPPMGWFGHPILPGGGLTTPRMAVWGWFGHPVNHPLRLNPQKFPSPWPKGVVWPTPSQTWPYTLPAFFFSFFFLKNLDLNFKIKLKNIYFNVVKRCVLKKKLTMLKNFEDIDFIVILIDSRSKLSSNKTIKDLKNLKCLSKSLIYKSPNDNNGNIYIH